MPVASCRFSCMGPLSCAGCHRTLPPDDPPRRTEAWAVVRRSSMVGIAPLAAAAPLLLLPAAARSFCFSTRRSSRSHRSSKYSTAFQKNKLSVAISLMENASKRASAGG